MNFPIVHLLWTAKIILYKTCRTKGMGPIYPAAKIPILENYVANINYPIAIVIDANITFSIQI